MRIGNRGRSLAVFVVASGAYLAAGAVWIYVVAARSDDYGGDPGWWWFVGGAFVLGLLTARWPAVVVPMLLPFIAVGAGRGTNPDSDWPIALGLFFIEMPVAALAAAIGVSVVRVAAKARRGAPRRNLSG
jgi:hypothetical protein